jgi:hypothetical protein
MLARLLAVTRLLGVFASVAAPTLASAQEPLRGWPVDVDTMSKVSILDDTGVEVTGRLVRLDDKTIVVRVDDVERQFEASRVRRIDRRGDSLRNGLIIGAIIGAAVGRITYGLADCPGARPTGPCPGARRAMFVGTTATYAALGAGIDALAQDRTVVYEAGPTASPSASTPIERLAAFNLRVTW